MDKISIEMTVFSMMRQFNVSKEQAAQLYREFLEHQFYRDTAAERKVLGQEFNELQKKRFILTEIQKPSLTSHQLEAVYYELKRQGFLIPIKVSKSTTVYLETDDFVGEQEIAEGTIVEINQDLFPDLHMEQIWLSPGCPVYIEVQYLTYQP